MEILKTTTENKREQIKFATSTKTLGDIVKDSKESEIALKVKNIIIANTTDSETGEIKKVAGIEIVDVGYVGTISPSAIETLELMCDGFSELTENGILEIIAVKNKSANKREYITCTLA